jgi:hypothetical protein
MAGLPWIQLASDWKGNKKAIRLRVFLEDEWAWAYVVSLWCWTAQHQGDGLIEGPGALSVIAEAAGWKGDPKHFVDCLLRAELLDETTNGYAVHDWADYAGAHIEKREKERKRLRTYRNRTRTKRVRSAYVHGERETERETDTDTTTHTQGAVDFRKAGAEAAAAVVSPGPAPLADSVLKILRAYGKNAMHASPEARASVESAIYGATPEIAASRIADAWNPATARILPVWNDAKPWLTFYLEAITGQTKAKATRKGMAPPSTDFTSPEATTL